MWKKSPNVGRHQKTPIKKVMHTTKGHDKYSTGKRITIHVVWTPIKILDLCVRFFYLKPQIEFTHLSKFEYNLKSSDYFQSLSIH